MAWPSLRGDLGAHDPSTIIKCKDKYYLFRTGQGIPSKSSKDKVFWTAGPSVFSAPPAWTTNAVPGFTGVFWAPDVFYLNGEYCLYYAVSSWGSQVSAIGFVTNPTLDPADASYHWTDQGPVIQSAVGSAYNTIDPSVTRDASGNPWMSFGSYWNGIYLVQLDPLTGLRFASNSPTYRLAYNGSIEASCLFRRGGYYYLFVNWGSCCAGVNSTYNIRVGRSTSITGPYLDRNGVNMVNNGGTLFLQGTGKFTGPGHVGVLSENGTQWFSYHYYDAGAWSGGYNAFGAPDFDLAPLSWTADDWPVFTNDWSAGYHFQMDARDENGQYYGLLLGGASIQNDPVHGRVLNLSGTNQYVQLPPGVAYARTFAAVVKWNGGGDWQRIFDFGTDTSSYVMLTPRSGTGQLRCDIRANGVTQTVAAPGPLPVGTWTHVALTLDGQNGILYVNGAPVATNAITISPLDTQAETNHLGHSKFVADPDFSGQIASFRAWGRVLSAAEIAAPQPVIAQPADGSVYWPGAPIVFNGSATDLADVALGASSLSWRVDYIADNRTNLVLGPLGGVTNGVFAVPATATGGGLYRVSLTATDGANRRRTVTATLSPANPPAFTSSYYPFRANAGDANGHYPGTLVNGASVQFDATRGNVLNLSGTNQYVSLPTGAAGFQTFMAWVKWNGGSAWQRIYDFGNDTTRYTVLTPAAANGRLRFNITVNGIPGEEIIDAPGPLPAGVWTHVAVVLDGSIGVLYTNGVPVATNANIDLLPGTLGVTNNYLGKSQWPDPYFNGQLSSVRLLSRPLSAAEVAAPQPVLAQPAQGAVYRPGDSIYYSGSASDFYDAPIAATGLTWTVQFRNAGATNTVLGPVSGITGGSFLVPLSGAAASNGYYHWTLSATDSAGRTATATADIFPAATATTTADWASYYPFTSGAQDASNRFNGSLVNGASIVTDASRGKVVNLSGVSQYVNLPAGAGAACAFAGWVKWNGGNAWQRIFDFGQDTTHWFFLTPLAGTGRMQCAISADTPNYVQAIDAPTSLPVGVWTHLAVVLDGRQGILYSNGQAVAINNSVNLLPADVAPTRCWFGRSQYPADAYFNGRLDSIQLNSRPLSIQALTAPVPVITAPAGSLLYAGGDTISFAGTANDYLDTPLPASAFAWTAEFHHDGLVDPGPALADGTTNGNFVVPVVSPASTNVFYRLNLQVTDAMGNSGAASRDLLPRISSLAFDTVPSGLQLSYDGQALVAPANIPAVAGMTRALSVASPQSFAGSNYSFVLWSDAGTQSHSMTVPSTNAAYTASFVQPSLGLGVAGSNLSLSWPAWAGGLQLQSATNLTPPTSWSAVTNSPVASGGLLLLNLPVDSDSRFYRLKSP